MIWIVLAALAIPSAGILLWPLLKKPQTGPEGAGSNNDLAVYRQQLRDLENDVARGIVDKTEAEDIKLEIQRRILRAGSLDVRPRKAGIRSVSKIATLSLGLLVIAFTAGTYHLLGSPNLPSRPLALRDLLKNRSRRKTENDRRDPEADRAVE